MEETNRVAAIFLSLLVIFVALMVILLTWGAPDETIERIADFANFLSRHNTTATQLLITFGAMIFILLALIVVILEVSPPQTGSVPVAKVGSGEVRIGTDEIASRLEEELRSVPRLRGAEATVYSRGARAEVKLDLVVDGEADVAQTATEAIQMTREIIERRMGVELDAPPRAEVHYSAGSHKRTAPSAPANTPSWQPSAMPPVGAAPASKSASEQASTTGGPVHEASSAVSEDRPAGA